jgi:biopolymer transport protein ExbD
MPLKLNQEESATINLTSLIDILFLLIMFFMVSTKFSEQEHHIALQMPKIADNATLVPVPDKRVVNVYRDGVIEVDRKKVTLPQLVSELQAARKQYPQLKVVVRGDGQITLDRIAEVVTAVKQSGVSVLDLAFSGGGTVTR